MSRITYLAFYLLQYTLSVNGQRVKTMPPVEACIPSSVMLLCPANYMVIPTSAAYGVARTDGSCIHTPGDCVANALFMLPCASESNRCHVYTAKTKLPECNDTYSSYIRIEYDCVPLSMADPAKEYDICQNSTEITSDHGILKSPSYRSSFQRAPYECRYSLRATNDKAIRLWLSDVLIREWPGSWSHDCVVVDDTNVMYQICSGALYAFPYLHSSTIHVRYSASTNASLYRGMKMYFEIVDRLPNDTATPIPTTPASLPVYAFLGVASPVQRFQLCKGESRTLQCPDNYTVVVRTNQFGVTASGQCEVYNSTQHCLVSREPTVSCRQRCMYMYIGNQVIPSCNNQIASYQYVEYQCIPTNTAPVLSNTSCSVNGSKTRIPIGDIGRFQSFGYPKLSTMNCTYRLTTEHNHIMHIYAVDISLNDYSSNCQANKISLVEDDQREGWDFCEERTTRLIYSTCSNEIDLRYSVTQVDTLQLSYGVDLYIESQLRPADWSCTKPLSTNSTQESISTWAQNLELSPILSTQVCLGSSQTLQCPGGTDYVLSIVQTRYGVSSTGQCQDSSSADCYQDISFPLNCTHSCLVEYLIPKPVADCGSQNADYLTIYYGCIPTRLSDNRRPVDICSSVSTDLTTLNSGMIISPNYPILNGTYNCSKRITAASGKLLTGFIVDLSLEKASQNGDCSAASLTAFDGSGRLVLCGSQEPRQSFISCSHIVDFQFLSTRSVSSARGFKVFLLALDAPSDWTCQSIGFVSTAAPLSMTTSTSTPNQQTSASSMSTRKTSSEHSSTRTTLSSSSRIPSIASTSTASTRRTSSEQSSVRTTLSSASTTKSIASTMSNPLTATVTQSSAIDSYNLDQALIMLCMAMASIIL